MAVKPKYTINGDANTASLDLYVDNVFVTTYSLANNLVTLEARPNTDVLKLTQLSENLQAIDFWISAVKTQLQFADTSISEFNQDEKKLPNKLRSTFTLQGTQVTKTEFNKNTKLTSFDPRPQIIMAFSDFCYWYYYLLRVYRDAATF